MRSLVVVNPNEVIEALLLLQEVEGSGLSGFRLQRQVHAFVTAVLLRVPGLDALQVDDQAQPPDRELGKTEQRIARGKRHAVVPRGQASRSVRMASGSPKSLNAPRKW